MANISVSITGSAFNPDSGVWAPYSVAFAVPAQAPVLYSGWTCPLVIDPQTGSPVLQNVSTHVSALEFEASAMQFVWNGQVQHVGYSPVVLSPCEMAIDGASFFSVNIHAPGSLINELVQLNGDPTGAPGELVGSLEGLLLANETIKVSTPEPSGLTLFMLALAALLVAGILRRVNG
jgi:hypothetical protein